MSINSWRQKIIKEGMTIASFYDRRAGYYDALVHLLSLGFDLRYRAVSSQRVKLQPGHRVLDLGCGTGLDLPHLSKRVGPSGKIIGLDISKGMLHIAHHRLMNPKLPNVSLVRGNALCLPFDSKTFEAIFCNYLLSTVPSEKVIEEAFRVARPGAVMMFADDLLPSGWFASPIQSLRSLFREGYFNSALPGIALLKKRLSSVTLTKHHGGLIFILTGIFS